MAKTVTIADTGEVVQFPDTIGEDEMLNSISQFRQAEQQANAFENQHPLAKGLQQLVGPQFGFQPPQPAEYKIPVVPGNTFGMTPQTLNNTLGIIQNTQNSNAAERIRQRVQIEQEMEREKDRAQQLKLEQLRLKNQQMMEKMRLDQEAAMEKEKQGRGTVFSGTGGTPVWAGVDPNTGQPFARAIPVEGATGKFKPLPGGAETVMINGKLTTAYTLYNEETGEKKFIELGATPEDIKELTLVDTVDEAGKPVRRFVRKEEGTSYPMPPKSESGALTEYQQIQIEQRKQEDARTSARQSVLRQGLEEIEATGKSDLILDLGEQKILSSKGEALAEQKMRMSGGGNASGPSGRFVPVGGNTFDWEP